MARGKRTAKGQVVAKQYATVEEKKEDEARERIEKAKKAKKKAVKAKKKTLRGGGAELVSLRDAGADKNRCREQLSRLCERTAPAGSVARKESFKNEKVKPCVNALAIPNKAGYCNMKRKKVTFEEAKRQGLPQSLIGEQKVFRYKQRYKPGKHPKYEENKKKREARKLKKSTEKKAESKYDSAEYKAMREEKYQTPRRSPSSLDPDRTSTSKKRKKTPTPKKTPPPGSTPTYTPISTPRYKTPKSGDPDYTDSPTSSTKRGWKARAPLTPSDQKTLFPGPQTPVSDAKSMVAEMPWISPPEQKYSDFYRVAPPEFRPRSARKAPKKRKTPVYGKEKSVKVRSKSERKRRRQEMRRAMRNNPFLDLGAVESPS